jgi:competence protein ComEA
LLEVAGHDGRFTSASCRADWQLDTGKFAFSAAKMYGVRRCKAKGLGVKEAPQRGPFYERLLRCAALLSVPAQPERRPLLRREDQSALGFYSCLALALMAIGWVAAGGLAGGLVDIDNAEPLDAPFQVDINSAEWTELMQLPEIGEALARRIVESRKQVGHFRSIDDLDHVPGIGPKTLDKIRPYLLPVE